MPPPSTVHVTLRRQPQIEALSRAVAWDDELSWGPVPDNLPILELKRLRMGLGAVRSRRLRGDVDVEPGLIAKFERLAAEHPASLRFEDGLKDLTTAEEAVLWLGPGKDQQLAFLQCLDFCVRHRVGVSATFVNPEQLRTADDVKRALESRRLLQDDERAIAVELWKLFRSSSPLQFHRRIEAISSFPLVRQAAQGLRNSFPSAQDGLDDIQRALMVSLSGRKLTAVQLVAAVLEKTDGGDQNVWDVLLNELGGPVPLITSKKPLYRSPISAVLHETLYLTSEARRVLNGVSDAIDLISIDRWIGGCHLDSATNQVYRWNDKEQSFVPPNGTE